MSNKSGKSGADIVSELRALALQFPKVAEGIACKGTAIECSTFGVGRKNFLFLSSGLMRIKLHESLVEATELADVGANGWVKIPLGSEDTPPMKTLKRWLNESFKLIVG